MKYNNNPEREEAWGGDNQPKNVTQRRRSRSSRHQQVRGWRLLSAWALRVSYFLRVKPGMVQSTIESKHSAEPSPFPQMENATPRYQSGTILSKATPNEIRNPVQPSIYLPLCPSFRDSTREKQNKRDRIRKGEGLPCANISTRQSSTR